MKSGFLNLFHSFVVMNFTFKTLLCSNDFTISSRTLTIAYDTKEEDTYNLIETDNPIVIFSFHSLSFDCSYNSFTFQFTSFTFTPKDKDQRPISIRSTLSYSNCTKI